MRKFLLVIFLFAGFNLTIQTAESWQEVVEVIELPCLQFVNDQSTPEFSNKWRKKLGDRIQQRITDQGGDYAMHLRSIFLDWASGKEKALKEGNKASYVELCLYLSLFIEKKVDLPKSVRERLTVEKAWQFVGKLSEL